LAGRLLQELSGAFQAGTFQAAAASAPVPEAVQDAAAEPLVRAPWSVACLAVLLQRCNDRWVGALGRGVPCRAWRGCCNAAIAGWISGRQGLPLQGCVQQLQRWVGG
jgi:hypothetical protein